MFDAVRDISLRTILLVAVVVWAMLAAIWFLSLGPGPGAQTKPAAVSASAPRQSDGGTEGTKMAAAPQVEPPTSEEVSTSGRDVVVSTAPGDPQEVASNPEASASGFVLQVGAFRSEESARTLLERLKSDGFSGFLQTAGPRDPLYRVLVGPFPDRSGAEARQESLKARGIESFVKTLE